MNVHDVGWTVGPICLDELVTVMAQYPAFHTWNGWLTPRMDAAAVEKVMAAFEDDPYAADKPPTHEWVGDVLHLTEYDDADPYVEVMVPDEDGLYALGAYSWCWSPDPETTEEEARA